jgi:outer membrane biosynthesis protein TonB
MTRVKHYPTASLPRTDRRYGAGVVFAAVAHALAIMLLASGWAETYFEGSRDPGPGHGGGGGGGGGRSIRYIDLPPLPTSASRTARPVAKPAPKVEIALPKPQVAAAEEPIIPNSTVAVPEPVMPVVARMAADNPQVIGPGTGTGAGRGVGSGTGGGQGTGRGPGIGSGTGPGSGGDGTAYYAPEPRAIIYPFEDPPTSVRGREFLIRFWVNSRGRVDKVEIQPEIKDRAFRAKLLERVTSWTFYAARTREGRPVNGRYEITYAP